MPRSATCRKPGSRLDNGPPRLVVVKGGRQYRRDGDLGPAKFVAKVGLDVQATVRIEAKDVKARSSNRAWLSIPKLNEHRCHADALSGELRETMLGGVREHLLEKADWKAIEMVVLAQQERSGRDAHDVFLPIEHHSGKMETRSDGAIICMVRVRRSESNPTMHTAAKVKRK